MKEALVDLVNPIREADLKGAISLFGGLGLLTIYLYQGHHSFFTLHFDPSHEGVGAWEWAAHGYQFAAALLLLVFVPALWIRFGLRESIREHGLTLGDFRFGVKAFGVSALLVTPLLYLGAGSADVQSEYPLVEMAGHSAALFALWALTYLIYYFAWEFFFRGFWQLGLGRRMGFYAALAVQTTASTLMHIGKPEGETALAIIGGVALGLIAIRTRSFLWVLLIHWYVGVVNDLFVILRSG